AANPHSCHTILTSLATVPGCQLEFCIDVPGIHLNERSQPSAQATVSTLGNFGDLAFITWI
ncbi:MAG: hypothetical protein KME22_29670, partial [Hassallia sp. WJT32-NPBG1]|nr:hypothetical protein [Hassallia sp. WJT32-NPBG1]